MTERQAELEAWVGRGLTEAEVKFMEFLVPIRAYVGNTIENVLLCDAWLVAPKLYLNYPIPPDARELVYGDASIDVTLRNFSIEHGEIPDTEDIAFVLSANYSLNPKPPSRQPITTAEDAQDWMGYITALGFTFADLITGAVARELINPQPIIEE